MVLREELEKHQEKLWMMGLTTEYQAKPLPPMADLIDWYLNFIISRAILQKKLSLLPAQQTLVASLKLTAANRVVVFGLGGAKEAGPSDFKKICQSLDHTAIGLGEFNPWIILPPDLGAATVDSFQKLTQTSTRLKNSPITVG